MYCRTPNKKQTDKSPPPCVLFLFFFVSTVFFTQCSFAEATETVITSDSLEYFDETNTYVAKGSVEISREDAVLNAETVTYEEATSDVTAEGTVTYREAGVSVQASKAVLNLTGKTGTLYDADIFYAKDNYYLSGKEIEKRGENAYYSPSAAFTTCDAPVPAWCFTGKNVDLVIGERLRARDASFRIKNFPVLYAPYVWVPILTTRQTGLLMPSVSQSKKRGFGLHIPFFWAISENRDATLVLDTYSRRGIGQGIEYRFLSPGGEKGYGWGYHIRDTELHKDFWEWKGLYENRNLRWGGVFLNVNILNEKDFYREYSTHLQTRTQRYLESTGEFTIPLSTARLYLLTQYWIDLKQDTEDVPQKLPEIGYYMNYTNVGSLRFSTSLAAANIWRNNGVSAIRADFYPKLLHSFGRDFVLSGTAAVRATAYSFSHSDVSENGVQRTAFEYDVVGHTRLYRKFDGFMHILEPSVRYHFIASSENDLPVFDATELFRKTSLLEFSLLNRLITAGSEWATARITQGIDTYNGDRPFLPLKLELSISKGIPLRLGATYNVHNGNFETISSDLSLYVFQTNFTIGQRYNRAEDIMQFTAGVSFTPYKNMHLSSSIWYDAKGGGIRDMNLTMRYRLQCWGFRIELNKKPGDYTVLALLELAGVNLVPPKDD